MKNQKDQPHINKANVRKHHEDKKARGLRRFGSSPWLQFGLLFFLTLVIYFPQFGHDFTNWDDNWLITDNPLIRLEHSEDILAILNPFNSHDQREQLGNEYLPIRDLSYAFNYFLSGYEPFSYHLLNWLLQLANTCLLWLLARKLGASRLLACLSASLFAVMPIHVETVAWLSARKDLLATFFVLLASLCYLTARRKQSKKIILFYSLALGTFVCALFSKVPVIIFPGLLLLFEIFGPRDLKPLSWTKRTFFILPFVLVGLMIFWLIALPIAQRGLVREPYGNNRLDSTLTALSALKDYFLSFLSGSPIAPAVDYPLQETINFSVIFSLGLLILSCGFLFFAFYYSLKKKNQSAAFSQKSNPADLFNLIGLGLGWCLISFIPVSNLFIITGTVYADRYAYLPSFGWALACSAAIVWLVSFLIQKFQSKKLVAWLSGLSLVIFLGWQASITYRTSHHWENSKSLWRWALQQDPENHTALFNQARTYHEESLRATDESMTQSLLQEAERLYLKALQHPARTYRFDPARAYAALAQVKLQRDDPKKALEFVAKSQAGLLTTWRKPDQNSRDYYFMAAVLENTRGQALAHPEIKDYKAAEEAFQKALKISKREQSAALNLAQLLTKQTFQKTQEEAREGSSLAPELEKDFQKALGFVDLYEERIGFKDAIAAKSRAEIQMKFAEAIEGKESQEPPQSAIKLYQQARKNFRYALQELKKLYPPRTKEIYTLLMLEAEVIQRVPGQERDAFPPLEDAQLLMPKKPEPQMLKLRLLFRLGENKQALKELQNILKTHPDYQGAKEELAALKFQNAQGLFDALLEIWKKRYHDFRQQSEKPLPASPSPAFLIAHFLDEEEFHPKLASFQANLRKALSLTKKTSDLNQRATELLTTFGEALYLAQKTQDAEEILRESFRYNQENDRTSELLATIYFHNLEFVSNKARAAFELGDRVLAEGYQQEMWTMIGNLIALSERAAEILAARITRHANKAKVLIAEKHPEGSEAYWDAITQVEELYHMAHLLDPEQVDALDQLNSLYRQSRRYPEAVSIYRKLYTIMEERPQYQRRIALNLGGWLLEWGHFLDRQYREAAKKNDNEHAQELRAQAFSAFFQAQEAYQDALELTPLTPRRELLAGFGAAYQKLAVLDMQNATDYLEEAISYYMISPEKFQLELEAVRRKRALLLQDPQAQLLELQALLEVLEQNPEASDFEEKQSEILERIASIEVEQTLEKARIKLGEQAFETTLQLLEKIGSHSSEATLLKAKALAGLGELDQAAELYARCYANYQALMQAGAIFLKQNSDDALARANAAYRSASALISHELEKEGLSQKRHQELLKALEEVEKANHQIDQKAVELLQAAREERSLLGAERLLRKALAITPENYFILLELARLLRKWGQLNLEIAREQEHSQHKEQAQQAWKEARRALKEAMGNYRLALRLEPPFKATLLLELNTMILDDLLPILEADDQKILSQDLESLLIQLDGVLTRLSLEEEQDSASMKAKQAKALELQQRFEGFQKEKSLKTGE